MDGKWIEWMWEVNGKWMWIEWMWMWKVESGAVPDLTRICIRRHSIGDVFHSTFTNVFIPTFFSRF